ncbi:hypothetical protein ES702_04428 [subsurface metagenome]
MKTVKSIFSYTWRFIALGIAITIAQMLLRLFFVWLFSYTASMGAGWLIFCALWFGGMIIGFAQIIALYVGAGIQFIFPVKIVGAVMLTGYALFDLIKMIIIAWTNHPDIKAFAIHAIACSIAALTIYGTLIFGVWVDPDN